MNINAIKNRFEHLKYTIKNNIDALIVTEKMLDASFPSDQFSMDGFAKQFHRDRNKNVCMYIYVCMYVYILLLKTY